MFFRINIDLKKFMKKKFFFFNHIFFQFSGLWYSQFSPFHWIFLIWAYYQKSRVETSKNMKKYMIKKKKPFLELFLIMVDAMVQLLGCYEKRQRLLLFHKCVYRSIFSLKKHIRNSLSRISPIDWTQNWKNIMLERHYNVLNLCSIVWKVF